MEKRERDNSSHKLVHLSRALTFHMTGTTEVGSVLVLHFSIFNPVLTYCKLTSNG